MRTHRKTFRLNKSEGKMMGVCAGLSDHFDIDVTLVRVAMVLALITTFPIAGFAYLVAALIADSAGARRNFEDAPRLSGASVEATRERMRDFDARMQAVESYTLSNDSVLAREIEALR